MQIIYRTLPLNLNNDTKKDFPGKVFLWFIWDDVTRYD